MQQSVEVGKELEKLNFNDMDPIRVRETGQSKEYEKKLVINGAIWRLIWWYGRGKHKSTRYGMGTRYEFTDNAVDEEFGIYETYISNVGFTVHESGKAEITKLETEKTGMQKRKWMKNLEVV